MTDIARIQDFKSHVGSTVKVQGWTGVAVAHDQIAIHPAYCASRMGQGALFLSWGRSGLGQNSTLL